VRVGKVLTPRRHYVDSKIFEKSCDDVDKEVQAQVEQDKIEKATVELVTGDESDK